MQKICIVIMESIWWNPRVRKQILSYNIEDDLNISCVGFMDKRYDKEKVDEVPCETQIVTIDERLYGKQKSILKKLKRDFCRFRSVRNAIIERNPDIIHANNLDALIPAYFAKRKIGCKLIYDSFEINAENYTGKRRALYCNTCALIERFLVKRVDLMIAVSNAAADYFKDKYKIARPMVITNSVLEKEIIGTAKTIKDNDQIEILNHGRFYDGRGYDVMALANRFFVDRPNIHLALRGFGEMEDGLREIVNSNPNSNAFRFYPKVRVDELIPLATKSNVGVAMTVPICLNFLLSVSNKIFEYAAAGLPVIMSNIPEHVYLNDKYNFGVVLEDDTPEAFVKAVNDILESDSKYNTLSRNALVMSRDLCWEKSFNNLICFERSFVN